MKPGRELDALVAKNIFGWKRREPAECENPDIDDRGWAACETCGWTGNWDKEEMEHHLDTRGSEPKYYSIDIAAAWEIVRHLRATTSCVFQFATPEDGDSGQKFRAIFLKKWWDDRSPYEWPGGETEAHAICLAALEWVKPYEPQIFRGDLEARGLKGITD